MDFQLTKYGLVVLLIENALLINDLYLRKCTHEINEMTMVILEHSWVLANFVHCRLLFHKWGLIQIFNWIILLTSIAYSWDNGESKLNRSKMVVMVQLGYSSLWRVSGKIHHQAGKSQILVAYPGKESHATTQGWLHCEYSSISSPHSGCSVVFAGPLHGWSMIIFLSLWITFSSTG